MSGPAGPGHPVAVAVGRQGKERAGVGLGEESTGDAPQSEVTRSAAQ